MSPGPLLFCNYFTYLYFCYVNCQKLTYIEFINRARNFTTDKHIQDTLVDLLYISIDKQVLLKNVLKVSKSQKQFMVFSILPTNEQNSLS